MKPGLQKSKRKVCIISSSVPRKREENREERGTHTSEWAVTRVWRSKSKKGSLVHTVQHMRRREYGLDGYGRRGTSSVATVNNRISRLQECRSESTLIFSNSSSSTVLDLGFHPLRRSRPSPQPLRFSSTSLFSILPNTNTGGEGTVS
jgi:hypothetical protein